MLIAEYVPPKPTYLAVPANTSALIVAMDINAEPLFLHFIVKNTLIGVAVALTCCNENNYVVEKLWLTLACNHQVPLSTTGSVKKSSAS